MKKIKRVSAFVFAMLFTVSNSYSEMIFGAEHEKETESISDVQNKDISETDVSEKTVTAVPVTESPDESDIQTKAEDGSDAINSDILDESGTDEERNIKEVSIEDNDFEKLKKLKVKEKCYDYTTDAEIDYSSASKSEISKIRPSGIEKGDDVKLELKAQFYSPSPNEESKAVIFVSLIGNDANKYRLNASQSEMNVSSSIYNYMVVSSEVKTVKGDSLDYFSKLNCLASNENLKITLKIKHAALKNDTLYVQNTQSGTELPIKLKLKNTSGSSEIYEDLSFELNVDQNYEKKYSFIISDNADMKNSKKLSFSEHNTDTILIDKKGPELLDFSLSHNRSTNTYQKNNQTVNNGGYVYANGRVFDTVGIDKIEYCWDKKEYGEHYISYQMERLNNRTFSNYESNTNRLFFESMGCKDFIKSLFDYSLSNETSDPYNFGIIYPYSETILGVPIDGIHYVDFRLIDKLGNVTESSSKGAKDSVPPKFTSFEMTSESGINYLPSGTYSSSDITVKIAATDKNEKYSDNSGLKLILVKKIKDDSIDIKKETDSAWISKIESGMTLLDGQEKEFTIDSNIDNFPINQFNITLFDENNTTTKTLTELTDEFAAKSSEKALSDRIVIENKAPIISTDLKKNGKPDEIVWYNSGSLKLTASDNDDKNDKNFSGINKVYLSKINKVTQQLSSCPSIFKGTAENSFGKTEGKNRTENTKSNEESSVFNKEYEIIDRSTIKDIDKIKKPWEDDVDFNKLEDGIHNFLFAAEDNAGNRSVPEEITFGIDREKPTGTFSFADIGKTGGAFEIKKDNETEYWFADKNDVFANIILKDGVSGIDTGSIQVKVNGNNVSNDKIDIIKSGTNCNLLLSSENVFSAIDLKEQCYNIEIQAKDKAGNPMDTIKQTIHVDLYEPWIDSVNPYLIDSNNSVINLFKYGIFANDIINIKIKAYDGDFEKKDKGNNKESQIQNVTVSLYDNKGNVIKTENKIVPVKENGEIFYTFEKPLEIRNDVIQMMISVSDNVGKSSKKDYVYTITRENDQVSVEKEAYDKTFLVLENDKPIVKIDKSIKPDYLWKANEKEYIWFNEAIPKIFTVDFSDSISGLKKTEIAENNSKVNDKQLSEDDDNKKILKSEDVISIDNQVHTYTFSTSGAHIRDAVSGRHELKAHAVDNAGNEAFDEYTYYIDNTAPEISDIAFKKETDPEKSETEEVLNTEKSSEQKSDETVSNSENKSESSDNIESADSKIKSRLTTDEEDKWDYVNKSDIVKYTEPEEKTEEESTEENDKETEILSDFAFDHFYNNSVKVKIDAADLKESSGINKINCSLKSFEDSQSTEEQLVPLSSKTENKYLENIDSKENKEVNTASNEYMIPLGFKGIMIAEAIDNVNNTAGKSTLSTGIICENEAPNAEHEFITQTNYKDHDGNPIYAENVNVKIILSDFKSGLKHWKIIQNSENSKDEVLCYADISSMNLNIGDTFEDSNGGQWLVEEKQYNLVTKVSRIITLTKDDNDIVLSAEVYDNCENRKTETIDKFSIDLTAPVIEIERSRGYNGSEEYYNKTNRAIYKIKVTERNFDESLINTAINNSYSGNVPKIVFDSHSDDHKEHYATVVFPEGDFSFSIKGSDMAGHDAVINDENGGSYRFSVDETEPVVVTNFNKYSDPSKDNYLNKSEKIEITVKEHNFDPGNTGLVLFEKAPGSEHNASGFEPDYYFGKWETDPSDKDVHRFTYTIPEDGVYQLKVRPTDKAGNSALFNNSSGESEIFEIDTEAPVLKSINGQDLNEIKRQIFEFYDEKYPAGQNPSVGFYDVNFSKLDVQLTKFAPVYQNGKELGKIENTGSEETLFTPEYTINDFSNDGVYSLKLTAFDKAGNTLPLNDVTFVRMMESEVLAYIPDSSISEKTGVYSFEYEDGKPISKRPDDFKDINIYVYSRKNEIPSIVLRDTNGEEKDTRLEENERIKHKNEMFEIVEHSYTLPGSFFTENYQSDVDKELYLTVKCGDGRKDLGRIHIDSISPEASVPDEFKSWHWFPGTQTREIKISKISEVLNEDNCKVFDNNKEIPFVYSKESGTLKFCLEEGWHDVGIHLEDVAGNEYDIQEADNICIGNFWIWIMAGGAAVSGAAAGAFVMMKKRKKKKLKILEGF